MQSSRCILGPKRKFENFENFENFWSKMTFLAWKSLNLENVQVCQSLIKIELLDEKMILWSRFEFEIHLN